MTSTSGKIVRFPVSELSRHSTSVPDAVSDGGTQEWLKGLARRNPDAIRDRDHALLKVWCETAENNFGLDFVIAELRGALERATANKEFGE